MTVTIEKRPIINGQWRFDSSISRDEVTRLAVEWRDGSEGEKYQSLGVRQCSRNEWAIAFTYAYENTKEYDDYMYKMTDQLKRRFGNGVHWDIASSLYVVK